MKSIKQIWLRKGLVTLTSSLFTKIQEKETKNMQITMTKEQVKEAFGELRYMGADYCYRYDKETRKRTEEVEALKLHLGSIKLGNSIDIRLETTELPKIEPYSVVRGGTTLHW